MILVIGGRSKIGSALIEILAGRGQDVRALLRSAEDASLPDGVQTVSGDLGERGSLDAAPENTIPSIDARGNFYVNAGDARISIVDTRDVAAVAAAVLMGSGHEGGSYDVTGPEALSYSDVADKLSAVAGRKIGNVDVPDDAVRETLLGFGMGEWLVGALVDLYQDYKRSGTDGYAAQVTSTVEELRGSPPRTLDQLLEESCDALGSA